MLIIEKSKWAVPENADGARSVAAATCDFCDISTNKWRIPLVAKPPLPTVVVWDYYYTNNIFYALGEKHSKKKSIHRGKKTERKIPFLSFRIYLYFIGVSNRHLTSAEKQINKMGGIDVCEFSRYRRIQTTTIHYLPPTESKAVVLHTTRLNRRLS